METGRPNKEKHLHAMKKEWESSAQCTTLGQFLGENIISTNYDEKTETSTNI